MPNKTLRAALVAAGILAAGTSAALLTSSHAAPAQSAAASLAPAAPAVSAAPAAASAPSAPALLSRPDYRAIVRQAGPAVVGVIVEGERAADDDTAAADPDPRAESLPPFFRGLPGFGKRGTPPSEPFRGQGSGFIVSEDGLVLTNAHVVRDARQVVVRLADRRELSAQVLGADPVTDVAVLRVSARGLPTVRLGDPRGLEVGDPVLAIGAPYGLEHSATQGIVSAKGRSLPGDAVVPFIQTDAAVNPGNSGGPLFDGGGAVIGINAQIFSRSGGFQGLSFAIPIDIALKVKDQILATGKAQHARLGVAAQDLDQTLARSFGLATPSGALISQVLPGSAAAAAGLKPGDVITAVGGQAVQRSGNLSSLIGLANPGERVMLTVWRDRAARELPVTLGSAPTAQAASPGAPAADGGRLGLALREPDAAERARLGLSQGLVIEQVSGAAARAGIRPGDALLMIEGQPVQSVAQARRLIQAAPDGVAVLIQREEGRFFVGLRPAARIG